MGGGPATSDDIQKMQEAQQASAAAAAAAQAMMDQNARYGPGAPGGGRGAAASPYPGREEGEDTIGMLRRKYGMEDDDMAQQVIAALGRRGA